MKLILLTHPASFASASMPRFAEMVRRGMIKRGHQVEIWTSPQKLGRWNARSNFIRKWLGYGDQFLIYPSELRKQVKKQPNDTLFAITDQALGMWVPHISHRPHVIHCNDFLALRSALNEFPENPTGWTGKQYQRLIRKGFSQGKVFISISQATQRDLHRFLPQPPATSEMVYIGLNYSFRPMQVAERMALLKKVGVEIPAQGIIVHVGGNQWYKNRAGVLKIYRAFARTVSNPPELWMIGAAPANDLTTLATSISAAGKVRFLSRFDNEQVNAAYSHARALLFPSLEEGFGWPIAEGMASGCPVITTNEAPMTEVAADAARLIPRMPFDESEQKTWAQSAAKVLNEVIDLSESERNKILEKGRLNAARFDTEKALDAYEKIYKKALLESKK